MMKKEFKLVHSQRQAQEYQQILEEMDSSNSSLLNQLSQVFVSNGGSLATVGLTSLSELNTANLQQRLKRNQQIVASLIQHIMQQKSAVIDELNKALNQLQNEFDEIKVLLHLFILIDPQCLILITNKGGEHRLERPHLLDRRIHARKGATERTATKGQRYIAIADRSSPKPTARIREQRQQI